MAEDLKISKSTDKSKTYECLLPQISALISNETDLIANLANVSAAIYQTFNFLWVGFYLKKENELVLGPFQGPIACTRIAFDKGVCGASFSQQKTIIVPDVSVFPGHIACNSASNSEIVLPLLNAQFEIIGVLDIDSTELNSFCEIDQFWLEKILLELKKNLLILGQIGQF